MLTARDLTAVIADDVLGDNPDCEASGLGIHVFTIAQTTGVTDPPTGFFSTGSVPVAGQTTEVTLPPSPTMCPPLCGWYIEQPLRLVAGAVNPSTGIAPIHLAQDVVYGYRIIDNATTIWSSCWRRAAPAARLRLVAARRTGTGSRQQLSPPTSAVTSRGECPAPVLSRSR
jgi:hypothetical protein